MRASHASLLTKLISLMCVDEHAGSPATQATITIVNTSIEEAAPARLEHKPMLIDSLPHATIGNSEHQSASRAREVFYRSVLLWTMLYFGRVIAFLRQPIHPSLCHLLAKCPDREGSERQKFNSSPPPSRKGRRSLSKVTLSTAPKSTQPSLTGGRLCWPRSRPSGVTSPPSDPSPGLAWTAASNPGQWRQTSRQPARQSLR